ncbi:hypothetical protein RRG08_001142 [Elysia crispata]|uniref:Uncharacterized protein n=1 Tax=Elysia crispata TaxID=231223 RepID=A0AAE1E3Z8_9GAST|nr:hypothetical protein RRG08_001142 [Elysia crispata]
MSCRMPGYKGITREVARVTTAAGKGKGHLRVTGRSQVLSRQLEFYRLSLTETEDVEQTRLVKDSDPTVT